jgi:hypothetical protein
VTAATLEIELETMVVRSDIRAARTEMQLVELHMLDPDPELLRAAVEEAGRVRRMLVDAAIHATRVELYLSRLAGLEVPA